MSQNRPIDVFLSYASADRAKADQVAHALEERELSVWFDKTLIGAGENVLTVQIAALRNARAFVVLVSKAAGNSEFMASELANALAANEAQGSPKIIPLKVQEDVSDLPFLRQFQYADATTPERLKLSVDMIVTALETDRRTISTENYSGPLPPPDQLARYEQIMPGAVDRLIAMAEREQLHRLEIEKTIKIRREIGTSLAVSLLVAIVGVGIAVTGNFSGSIAVASTIGGAAVAILTHIFTRLLIEHTSGSKKSEGAAHE
ncbi:DUF2335 domain-containing protein [Gluconacetobacter takamatsuzukensis]|uniref:DUF2335 domain-containing protein n=1 Tax=Gluconacetobacter takamatsuzukensis TaxID=1286190 RepID=A0A7W4KGC9_9PROT|nr:DUF2335 domain-containing protein [Gluconacetobacter takamatsuzukensis]MBB2206443.1 DUF2335 domain-containing protein [Gluconacetobacter takamatsuzukensis]